MRKYLKILAYLANEIMKQITKKVNGGKGALSDRQQAFHKIQSNNIFEEFLKKNNE